MKNLISRIKQATPGEIINFCCFLVSIILGIISFICPPTGQIDPSVLTFIAEIGVLATISKIPDFIRAVMESHTNLEIKRGDTVIKVESDDETK